jgi:hypothetical protein
LAHQTRPFALRIGATMAPPNVAEIIGIDSMAAAAKKSE